MLRIILVGYGEMSQVMKRLIDASEDLECVGITGSRKKGMGHDLAELLDVSQEKNQKIDVVIDFSHPDNLEMILKGMEKHPLPLVMATTGFTDGQNKKIKELAQKIPIVYASNSSLGNTIMKRIVKEVQHVLGDDFDTEIIEKHHNKKIDSPSGTAKMLLDAIDPEEKFHRKYGRVGMAKRTKEIGIHSIRGGSIAGEHEVIFAGENEVLEIIHKADSKQVFARGAIRAARFILGKTPGIYDMDHVLASILCGTENHK